MTKKKTPTDLRRHAKMRARQRYGLDLSFEEIEWIEQSIRDQKSTFIRKESNTVTKHRVWFKDQWITVLYNKKLRALCSVVPPEETVNEA